LQQENERLRTLLADAVHALAYRSERPVRVELFSQGPRLLKYLRDIKTRFVCSSVLLTTLLGYQIKASDKGSAAFSNTPRALQTLVGRMDDWLQANEDKPEVRNPFLPDEDFAEVWTDTQYKSFRNCIHR
jgi:hypothetical protein